jgi:hypothetical protein
LSGRSDDFKGATAGPADVPPAKDPAMPGPSMSTEEALGRIAGITEKTHALRVRTEGLTLALWAVCMAASYLTIVVPLFVGRPPDFEQARRNFSGNFSGNFTGRPPRDFLFFNPFAPLAWFLIASVMTVGVWRSASLSFQTGITTPRLVAVLVSWLVLLLVTTVTLSYIQRNNLRGWHLLAWAVVLVLFALLNPLRFTRKSRVAVGVASLVTLAASVYALSAGLDPRELGFFSGLALGVPLLLSGLYLMFFG